MKLSKHPWALWTETSLFIISWPRDLFDSSWSFAILIQTINSISSMVAEPRKVPLEMCCTKSETCAGNHNLECVQAKPTLGGQEIITCNGITPGQALSLSNNFVSRSIARVAKPSVTAEGYSTTTQHCQSIANAFPNPQDSHYFQRKFQKDPTHQTMRGYWRPVV